MKLFKAPIFTKQSFIDGVGWIALIFGGLFYIGGHIILYYSDWLSQTTSWTIDHIKFWSGLAISIGDILLVGGVVGFLTSAAQWKGIIVQELTNIVYGKELLSKRSDLKAIWENVTKQLFKNKFKHIHRDILDSISHYLPTTDNEICYYDNFTEDISVTWEDKDACIVKTTEIMSFDIIAESEAEVDYTVRSKTVINPQIGKPEDCVRHTIHLNEQEYTQAVTNHERSGIFVVMNTSLQLKGSKKYHFKFTIEKKYNLKEDFTIAYKAKRYIHNMHVSLLLDEGISAEFIERGEYEPFCEVKKTKQNIIMDHSGVILPHQGFIFALKID